MSVSCGVKIFPRPVLTSYIFTPVLTARIVIPIHLSTEIWFSKLLCYLAGEYSNKKRLLHSGEIPQKSPILYHKLKKICKKNDNFGLKTTGKLKKKR